MDTEYLLLVGILLYTFRNESLHLLPTGRGKACIRITKTFVKEGI